MNQNQNQPIIDSEAVQGMKNILATANLSESEKRGLQFCIDTQIKQDQQTNEIIASYIGSSEDSQILTDMKLFLATAKLTKTERRAMEFLISQQKGQDQFMKDMAASMAAAAANRAEITQLQAELVQMNKLMAEQGPYGFSAPSKGTEIGDPNREVTDEEMDDEMAHWGRSVHESDAERNARRLSIINEAGDNHIKEIMPAIENLAIKVGNKALEEYEASKGTQAHQPFMDDATNEADPMDLIFDKVTEMREKLSADSGKVATDEEIKNWGNIKFDIMEKLAGEAVGEETFFVRTKDGQLVEVTKYDLIARLRD